MNTQTETTDLQAPAAMTRRAAGFTLLEIMMVVIIIGIVGTIAISGLNFKGNAEKAKVQATKTAMTEIQTVLTTYYVENNKYPPSLETLVQGNVLNRVKPDGWGNPLKYDAKSGVISTGGSDLTPGFDINNMP